MLKIGEFSKLSRISIRQLRNYDEAGLLIPAFVDTANGYRYYSESQLMTANRITALKRMGFTQPAAAEALACYGSQEALERCLLSRRAEAQAALEQAVQCLQLLDTAIERLRKDERTMNYDVTVKTIPERYVASVRGILPSYEREGDLWSIFCQETACMNLRDGDPVLCVAIFHDGEFKERDVDVEIQKNVIGSYPDTEHVKFKVAPALEVASATFQGSYDQIGQVNEAVTAWIAANGYTFAGPFFNIYHVSPHKTRNQEEFVTEICYPVQRK